MVNVRTGKRVHRLTVMRAGRAGVSLVSGIPANDACADARYAQYALPFCPLAFRNEGDSQCRRWSRGNARALKRIRAACA